MCQVLWYDEIWHYNLLFLTWWYNKMKLPSNEGLKKIISQLTEFMLLHCSVLLSVGRVRETGRPFYTFPTKTADLYYILEYFPIYELRLGVLSKRSLSFHLFLLQCEYYYSFIDCKQILKKLFWNQLNNHVDTRIA